MSLYNIIHPNNYSLYSKNMNIGTLEIIGDDVNQSITTTELYEAVHGSGGTIPTDLQVNSLVFADSNDTIQTVNVNGATPVNCTASLIVKPSVNASAGFTVRTNTNDELFNVNTSTGAVTSKYNILDNGGGVMSSSSQIKLSNLTMQADSISQTITGTELSYLSGASSNIQNQLNALGSNTSYAKYESVTTQTYIISTLAQTVRIYNTTFSNNITLYSNQEAQVGNAGFYMVVATFSTYTPYSSGYYAIFMTVNGTPQNNASSARQSVPQTGPSSLLQCNTFQLNANDRVGVVIVNLTDQELSSNNNTMSIFQFA
jgi:hypothetical protein